MDRLRTALSDRYQIERELGAGGMATVYLAHDVRHDRKVAIKVLKPELAAVLGADRFVVEIRTTASLQHPHILPLFDSGTAGVRQSAGAFHRRILDQKVRNGAPAPRQWSPDGKQIAFTRTNGANDEDIFVLPSDGRSQERLLVSMPGRQNPTQWLSADTILLQSDTARQIDLATYSLTTTKMSPYLQGPWTETDLQVSPDGTLAAFMSTETGTGNIWLRTFPEPQGKWAVSLTSGMMPRWSPDGRDLYYWAPGVPDSLFRVRIDQTPSVRVNTPQFVLAIDLVPTEGWDIHPDGKRFVAVRTRPRRRPPRVQCRQSTT